ncbi:MAG: hypothetical protein V2A56_11985 [bacterium]
MKTVKLLLLLLTALLITSASVFASDKTPAPVQHGPRFVDLNGDGFNDNAPDLDGDGIPNGQDSDFVRPLDGSGSRHVWAEKRAFMYRTQSTAGVRFIDENGDGICDNAGNANGFHRGCRLSPVNGQGAMTPGAHRRAVLHGMRSGTQSSK